VGQTDKPETPSITTEQVIEVDRAMVEDFGINLTRMMENAGRVLVSLAHALFPDDDPAGKRMAVLAGSCDNGSGGLVCARRLSGWGAAVDAYLAKPAEELAEVTAGQLAILQRMAMAVHEPPMAADGSSPPISLSMRCSVTACWGQRAVGRWH
jgi:NAD(P)H-hydrate epimerase